MNSVDNFGTSPRPYPTDERNKSTSSSVLGKDATPHKEHSTPATLSPLPVLPPGSPTASTPAHKRKVDINNSHAQPATLHEPVSTRTRSQPPINRLHQLIDLLNELDIPDAMKANPIKHIFSPELNKTQWQQQRAALQQCNAEICGISMSDFKSVDVIDLSEIGGTDVNRLRGRSEGELIVVHGKCTREGLHLPIAKGITVIGSGAEISINGHSIFLQIPEAIISANSKNPDWFSCKYKEETEACDWVIIKQDPKDMDDIEIMNTANTYSALVGAGHFPLIYLNQSSLIGVTLNCEHCVQAIVGSKGEMKVINNVINNSLHHGIFLHDCYDSTIRDNNMIGGASEVITLSPEATQQRIDSKLPDYLLTRDEHGKIIERPITLIVEINSSEEIDDQERQSLRTGNMNCIIL